MASPLVGDTFILLEVGAYALRAGVMAQQARADRRQFLEHLILRAEAVWNFQPPLRPWWNLWGKDPEPEVPAIVADLLGVA